MKWYLKVVRDNYANFNGRARRKEFWMFVLFNMIISWLLTFLDNTIGLTYGVENSLGVQNGILSSIYSVVILIPSLAVSVRRVHDTNKSGWNLLWAFTIIGLIYVMYLYLVEGDHSENNYGTNPKEEDDQTFTQDNDTAHNPIESNSSI